MQLPSPYTSKVYVVGAIVIDEGCRVNGEAIDYWLGLGGEGSFWFIRNGYTKSEDTWGAKPQLRVWKSYDNGRQAASSKDIFGSPSLSRAGKQR